MMEHLTREHLIHLFYFISALLFVFGLRCFRRPNTGRLGTGLAALAMLIAVVGTLIQREIVRYDWIIAGLAIGTIIGIPMGLWIPMTKTPERIALSHSFGGLAIAIVGVIEYYRLGGEIARLQMATMGFEVLLGAVTFTGSLMAFGKLQGFLPSRPMTFKLQNEITLTLIVGAALMVIALVVQPMMPVVFYSMCALSLLIGFLLVFPIGGADMPVVICLLNSYAGLAAAASGFALKNNILIICGSLDGGSGFILAILMSKAMNRSFTNVLFGAFGKVEEGAASTTTAVKGTVRGYDIEDAAIAFDGARLVIFVPGYGMAVSQAQHAVKELADVLIEKGIDIKYAIHPVAGRMPGHMNVLLAEANVPYDQLYEMEQINPLFAEADVALVVGANDITNPAARTKKDSPIYGMPILEVDRARTIMVSKRSMNPGFAGIDNELYYNPKTMMLFGDAKDTITKLARALKQ